MLLLMVVTSPLEVPGSVGSYFRAVRTIDLQLAVTLHLVLPGRLPRRLPGRLPSRLPGRLPSRLAFEKSPSGVFSSNSLTSIEICKLIYFY